VGKRPEHRRQVQQCPGRNGRGETGVPFQLCQASLPDTRQWFFFWQPVAGRKQPYYIHPTAPGDIFAFAGLLAAWTPPDGETVVSTCIITTGPNQVMAPIHDRMPAILAPEQFDDWLDPGNHDTAALTAMLMPSRPELLSAYPVSPAINSGRVEGPVCVEPVNSP